ncbi:MAG TPA: hypothetical protein VFU22_05800 [Roseiflexaceae bacterium]|nr:hypothetical protein [Roseiflexaceae bacterium]
MSYVKRMLQQPTIRKQRLIELALIVALIFGLSMAVNAIGHNRGRTTANDQMSGAVVISHSQNHPAVVARVPYEAGWQLYDNGWAGGPRSLHGTSSASALVRVPYEVGWHLYDNGWAGGPRRVTAGQMSK